MRISLYSACSDSACSFIASRSAFTRAISSAQEFPLGTQLKLTFELGENLPLFLHVR